MSSTQKITLLILLAFAVPALYGQGTTTYSFLRNDVGARAAALGGGFVTGTDDPNAMLYNPASLATLTNRRLSVGFFKNLMDINSGSVTYGAEVQGLGFIGGGVEYVNYGEFQRTGSEGQNLGTFGAGDLAITAGYGASLQKGLNYGFNVKFIYSSIAEARSSAAAVDAGIQYTAVPERLIIGASLLNAGAQIDPYVNTREKLPLNLRIGASVFPEHLPAAIYLGFERLSDSYDTFADRFKQFSLGAEFTASESMQLRFGYNNERRQELKIGSGAGLAGISLGLGFSTGSYTIDYGFVSLGSIGAYHQISVGF